MIYRFFLSSNRKPGRKQKSGLSFCSAILGIFMFMPPSFKLATLLSGIRVTCWQEGKWKDIVWRYLYIAVGSEKWNSCFGSVWQFLKVLTELSHEPAILVLDIIYPREMKIYIHTKTCMNVHCTLCTVARSRNKPRCPSSKEWTNIHIMKYYWAIKSNEVLIHTKHGWPLKLLC